jgi:putative endonuclease
VANWRALRGHHAENLAAEFLIGRGLVVLERNLRCRFGEIDLVCRDGPLLVMVEVRQRTRCTFGGAVASITPSKQRKLARSARYALQRRPEWRGRRIRFDVVGMDGSPHDRYRVTWIRDAFRIE